MLYIRFYYHDLFPENSGIAVYDGRSWKRICAGFNADDLEFLKIEYPKALLQNTPLPDLSF